MILVGVYGGIASGKSVLLEVMEEAGIPVLDSDRTVRDLLDQGDTPAGAELKEAICTRFGPVYNKGKLDPEKLGSQLRKDLEARRELADITHRFTAREIGRQIREYGKSEEAVIATDAPQILKEHFPLEVNIRILVTAPFLARVFRLSKRDSIPLREAERRVKRIEAIDGPEARYTLENSGSFGEFRKKCREFLDERTRFGW